MAAIYEPGQYEFAIEVSDPDGRFAPLVIRSNVFVDRPMSDQQVAQAIVTSSAGSYPDYPVLRISRPAYRLVLRRR